MFKQRLLTVLLLVPIVLLAIYYGNFWFLCGVLLLLVAIGGWEWLQLISIHTLLNKFYFMSALLLLAGFCIFSLSYYWFISGLMLWVLIFIALLTFPTSQAIWGHRILVGGACLLLLPLFASTMIIVYEHTEGRDLLVYLLCIVWAADTGAYLTGKWFGHHKLIPLISPGKTVEGTLGGFLLAMVVASIGYFYFKPESWSIWYSVAAATTFISMVGDLFISMLKRRSQLKDTGRIFPGHGGVLDRIDSLIAAAPLFYYGLSFVELGL
jgi:CDP-diglyceride synthetase